MMTGESVVEIITWLTAAGIPIWLDGGWGIDALLGRQTRWHNDLDIVLALEHASEVQRLLAAHGFQLIEQEWPTRIVLRDVQERCIDVHLVTFDAEGGGVQILQIGSTFRYPPEGFRGVGRIDATELRCLSPKVQLLCHVGYEPGETDRHDVRLLHEHFGLPLPSGYEV